MHNVGGWIRVWRKNNAPSAWHLFSEYSTHTRFVFLWRSNCGMLRIYPDDPTIEQSDVDTDGLPDERFALETIDANYRVCLHCAAEAMG